MDFSVRTETVSSDDQSWLKSGHGTSNAQTGTLDTSLFTKNTHYPNGFIRSGTPLGKVTATGLYGPYDNAATDGREVLNSLLFTPQAVPASGNTKIPAPRLLHGIVREARLPIAIDTAGKADVAGRIIFD